MVGGGSCVKRRIAEESNSSHDMKRKIYFDSCFPRSIDISLLIREIRPFISWDVNVYAKQVYMNGKLSLNYVR
jgi:hypothetical protein